MITLYDYAPSPHCVRVRAALALASLAHRKVPIDLDGDQRRPTFRALTPFGTVPVLTDGKAVLAQSYAALLWIGERRPPLLGRGATRARVLTWIAAAATELDPPVRRAYDLAYFEKGGRRHLDGALSALRDVLVQLEATRAHDDAPWVAGKSVTLADVALLPSFWLLADLVDDFAVKLPPRRWPWWTSWYARLRARPEIARVLAEADADT
jgi:glutathione S-transferase